MLLNKRFMAVVIVLASMLGGFYAQQWYQSKFSNQTYDQFDHESIIGQSRPIFSLFDLSGTQRAITEWDGKIVVVNFWATWCPPCREEIPEFIDLQSTYQSQGVQFLGIALQEADEVRPFYEEMGMNYPTLVGQQTVIKVAKAFGNTVGALPYTAVIDQNGTIVFTKRGELSAAKAESVLQSLL